MYIELLREIYTNVSLTVHLHKESSKIIIKRGVRQGDTISHKLFTLNLRLEIYGEYFSHHRFTDDILICANTPYEIKQMLQELADKSETQDLKLINSKKKVMMRNDTPIYVNNTQIENVESYIYLPDRQHQR